MTIKKNDTFSGNDGKAPDDVNDQTEGVAQGTGQKDAAKAYDAIAYAARTDSIKDLIEEFGSRHFTPEYITFAFNLCDKISITPDLDILRGQKSIWAAAIVHLIARLNFLFDASGELVLTPALICTHFNANKSTVGNKASQIQKFCEIEPGTRGYCRQEIVDAVTFNVTVDDIILPPNNIDKVAAEEEKPKNPAMRILEFRREQEEENKKLQALMEESKKISGEESPMPPDDKQLKLFE